MSLSLCVYVRVSVSMRDGGLSLEQGGGGARGQGSKAEEEKVGLVQEIREQVQAGLQRAKEVCVCVRVCACVCVLGFVLTLFRCRQTAPSRRARYVCPPVPLVFSIGLSLCVCMCA